MNKLLMVLVSLLIGASALAANPDAMSAVGNAESTQLTVDLVKSSGWSYKGLFNVNGVVYEVSSAYVYGNRMDIRAKASATSRYILTLKVDSKGNGNGWLTLQRRKSGPKTTPGYRTVSRKAVSNMDVRSYFERL